MCHFPFSRAVIAAGLALAFWLAALTPAPAGLVPIAPVGAQGPKDQQVREIARELKCPVCQNLSVADSPSPLAEQMRASIQEQVAAGRSRQEIVDYFVARYGEEVLLDPPKQGFAQLVWWGAGLILIAGVAGVAFYAKQRLRTGPAGAPADPAAPPDPDQRDYEAILERELYADPAADAPARPAADRGGQPGARRPGVGPTPT